jgi:glycosyltransferase involved in cell wall biosynthesis
MLGHHLYYRFKPWLPRWLRLGARRCVARHKLRTCRDAWPINEAAGGTPAGWPGWPDGKSFAFVLTHDVEGRAGLDQCRQLMELEKKLGFRSSFNFIPEGGYRVSAEFREELVRNGFEVGVHDLRHDGKLFWKRAAFPENARRINHYLHEWRAAGFRSGFMFHNRECLAGLDIAYDASAVDTDPFEPEPWVVGRIFPFWVPRSGGGGHVELPYTLPQDSTLFLVLRETSPEIWRRKLDWIVRHGGMALLNVHPDYLNFTNGPRTNSAYPVEWYAGFLKRLRDQYGDRFWNPLPRELAGWYKGELIKAGTLPSPGGAATAAPPSTALVGRRAAVVLYSYYESDPRPRREAEALAGAGMTVDVICLRPNSAQPRRTTLNGVSVHHVSLRRRRGGKLLYMLQYGWFLLASFALLTAWSRRRRYDLVHVHNMPDFLVFSALVPRWRGAKIILDLHDPMPELFQSIFGLPVSHRVVRALKAIERWSTGFADLVLTPNLAFKQTFADRSCPPEKIQTVMNSPATTIFNPDRHPPRPERTGAEKPFVLMYHGLLVERHGLDVAIRAIALLRPKIPSIELHLYGEPTEYSPVIAKLIHELHLENAVFSHGYQPLERIAASIAQIDLGLVPNRLSVFTAINFPTRIFEYLAMRKPVIVPRTRGIGDYFQPDQILFFTAGEVADLADKIEWAYRHPDALQALMERGRAVYQRWTWNLEARRFLGLVENLVVGVPPGKPGAGEPGVQNAEVRRSPLISPAR